MSGGEIERLAESSSLNRKLIGYWWLILVTVGIATGVAWLVTINQAPVYRSSTRLVVGPSERITNAREVMEVYNTLDRRSVVATLSKMAVSGEVTGPVLSEISGAHNYETNCVVVPDTNILEITVTGPDAETAAAVANATARHTIPLAAELYDSFQLKRIDAAGVTRIVRPALPRNLAAGAALGLISGLMLAYLASSWSNRREARSRFSEDSHEEVSAISPAPEVVGTNRL